MRNGQPHIIPLLGDESYIASNLYAPSRDVIANWLSQQLTSSQQANFIAERKNQLQKGQAALRELKFDGISSELLFGKTALAQDRKSVV